MKFRVAAVGFLAGLVVASACGPTKPSTVTALYVRVFFNPSLGTRSLVFLGADDQGLEVFPRSEAGSAEDAGPFTSPQTVRIYLLDSLAGQTLHLTVAGLDSAGQSVEADTVVVVPVLNAETEVEVRLKPYTEPTDGGDDAGTFDAGLLPDGGNPDGGSCACTDGGCCSGNGQCAVPVLVPVPGLASVPVVLCGPAKHFCSAVCPVGSADRCVNGQCLCGAQQCQPGQRCSSTGGGSPTCVCDSASRCEGCCGPDNVCYAAARSSAECGNAALQCEQCDNGVSCRPNGVCEGECLTADSTQCCSGRSAHDSRFPVCRNLLGACIGCDPYRSNQCDALGGRCACGDAGTCSLSQVCVRFDGGAACRGLQQ